MDDNQPKQPSSGDDLPPDGHNELTLTVDSIFVGKEFRTESYSQPWVMIRYTTRHDILCWRPISFLCNIRSNDQSSLLYLSHFAAVGGTLVRATQLWSNRGQIEVEGAPMVHLNMTTILLIVHRIAWAITSKEITLPISRCCHHHQLQEVVTTWAVVARLDVTWYGTMLPPIQPKHM